MTPAAHREDVAYLQSTYEMSEWRTCLVIGADRASALRSLMAPRRHLLPPIRTQTQINSGLSLRLDEKRGTGH